MTCWTRRSIVCLVMAWALLPVVAAAQTLSPSELAVYVKPGQLVSLTAANGEKATGRVESLTESAMALVVEGGHRQTIPSASLKRVVIKDSVKEGALIGLIAGALPGVLVGIGWKTYCENESASCPTAPLIFGGIFAAAGAGIGAGIDGLIHRRITVAPVIRSKNQGIQISFSF